MKNKIVTILLSAIIIISVAGNIYLLNQSKTVSTSLASATTELNNLSASITEKDNLITEANTTISELETTIADLQSQITTLTETVSALEIENQELLEQKTVPEVDGTDPEPESDTDGDPFDDNYLDQLVKEILAEQQPSGGSSSTAGSSTPEADAYVQEHGYGTYDPSTSNGDYVFGSTEVPDDLKGNFIQ